MRSKATTVRSPNARYTERFVKVPVRKKKTLCPSTTVGKLYLIPFDVHRRERHPRTTMASEVEGPLLGCQALESSTLIYSK